MATYPLATVACTISATGVTGPAFADIFASFQASTEAIYGSDTYLDADAKDGALLSVLALAQSDSNQATIAAVNNYNPQTALGIGLDYAVQVNGLVREQASNSTVTVSCVGTTGTILDGVIVQDQLGNLWNLAGGVIPDAGTIDVTATCQTAGDIQAPAGTVNIIYTIILGLNSVTNAAAALPGAALETDGALRARQEVSTTILGETMLQALNSAIGNVAGVSRVQLYANDTNATDANGIPSGNIAAVVLGGNIAAVALAIQQKKAPGIPTYGTTTVQIIDPLGIPSNINFFELVEVPIFASITLQALTGYTTTIGTQIQAALAAFVTGLAIGEDVYLSWAQAVAGLTGAAQQTFVITAMTLGTSAGALAAGNVNILFNQAASMVVDNINLDVL